MNYYSNLFLCIWNAKLFYEAMQIGAKYSYVIRFLIPFTVNASYKIYA